MKKLTIFFIALLLSAILFTQYTSADLSGTKDTPQNLFDLNPPVISYTPLLNTNSTASRTLTVTITDVDGVPTSSIGLPVLYWKINSGSWNAATGTFISGNNYQFTFGSGVVVANVVYYYIVAQDMVLTPNVGAFPSGGAGGFTANPPAASTPPTFPSNYSVTFAPLSGDITIGLLAFNKITGKNITFEKATRKVIKNVMVEEQNSVRTFGKVKSVEVEETYWIPMENGKKYNGPLYVLKSEHPELIYPMNITGIYATITAAVNDLNFRGVGGATRLLLDDATYTSETLPIVFNITNENGTNSIKTVTLKPNTAVTPTISGSAGGAILKILNSYVTIDGSNTTNGTTRDLTLSNTATSASFPEVISVISPTTTPITNSGIINCNIINGDNGTSAITLTNFSFAGGYFNNITIQNNNIQRAYYGIFFNADTTVSNGSGLVISGNTMSTSGANSIRLCGIYVQGSNGATISGNDIGNFETATDGNDNGIWLGPKTQNAVIEKNKIYSLGYTGGNNYAAQGISVSTNMSPANIIIRNNAIYDISGFGNSYNTSFLGYNPIGIYLFGTQSGINIYNNSINLFGNTLSRFLAMSMGICLGSGTTSVDIRNNNIVNNLGIQALSLAYGSCAIYAQTDNIQFTDINYNNYFVNPSGSGVKAIGQISSSASTTLSGWATATGKDLFSINGDPGFTSSINLQPDVNNVNCWNIHGGALPLSTVPTDINNNPRRTSVIDGACDIGAYEFAPVVSAGNRSIIGNIIDGGTSKVTFAGNIIATITWHANGGTLPSSISAVFQPGVNPPNVVLNSQYANEDFTITVPDGSGYLYDIVYKYNLARQGTISSESLFRIAKYSSTVWTQFTSTPNTTNKTVSVTGLNSFSTFTFGDGNAPLPVNITSFTSSVIGRDVKLNWTTATENNNEGFEIQKSEGSTLNSVWINTGFVNGSGTKNTPTNYTFTDSKLNSGKYKYRLKQIDYNGNFNFYNLSNVIEIGIPSKFNISQNYPNPFNPTSKIDFDLPFDSKVSIKLYDISGREILAIVNEQKPAGFYTVIINAESLSSGVYFYRIEANGNNQKFITTKKALLIK